MRGLGPPVRTLKSAGPAQIYIAAIRANMECRQTRAFGLIGATSVLPEKWEPVFRSEARSNKDLGHFRDSKKSGKALGFESATRAFET